MMQWFFAAAETAVQVVQETAAAPQVNPYEGLSLMSKGLITTVIGLLGVFLVLGLYFVTIKLMQRIKSKDAQG